MDLAKILDKSGSHKVGILGYGRMLVGWNNSIASNSWILNS